MVQSNQLLETGRMPRPDAAICGAANGAVIGDLMTLYHWLELRRLV